MPRNVAVTELQATAKSVDGKAVSVWKSGRTLRERRGQPRQAPEEGEQEKESGFTLLETMVAMAVFSATLVPSSSVFFGGMQAASNSNLRVDAVGVAESTLADVQALPFNEVGFYGSYTYNGSPYPGQAGFVSTCPVSVTACAGEPTVNLVDSGTFAGVIPSTAFAPVSTQKVGVTNFTVTTYITWGDATVPVGTCATGSTICQGAYPQVTVVVSWGGLQASSVTESSIVYPGGQGAWTAPGWSRGVSSTCPSSPTAAHDVSAAATSTSSQSTQAEVTVSWDQESVSWQPCYYVVDEATSPGALPTTSSQCSEASSYGGSPPQLGSATSYEVTGLSWGTGYYFVVVAFSAGGASCAPSDVVSVTTPPGPSSSTCTVTSLTVTAVPSDSTVKTYEDIHGFMTDNLNLVAGTSGSCSDVTVESQLVGATVQDTGSPYTLTAGTGGQFTDTVPSQGEPWTTGQHEFTVYVNGAATTHYSDLEVCPHAGAGQKTSGNSCP